MSSHDRYQKLRADDLRSDLHITLTADFELDEYRELNEKMTNFIEKTLNDARRRVKTEERREFYYSLIDEDITENTDYKLRNFWENRLLSSFRNLGYITSFEYSGSRRILTFKIEF